MLLDFKQRAIQGSRSPLSFVVEGGGSWPKWDRYLAIDGKKAFHIGNVCGTCSFFFERMGGANQSINPREIAVSLNAGVSKLDSQFMEHLEAIIPNGEYYVLLSEVAPMLVSPGDEHDYFSREQVELWGIDGFWGMPHFPKTEYYRLATVRLPEKRELFEFLIPTFPRTWLDASEVAKYQAALQLGSRPTAVSLSVLDIKGPADWEGEREVTEHLCLAHYLVDGHHKAYAAAVSSKPITLLSFLAVGQSVASKEQLHELVRYKRDA